MRDVSLQPGGPITNRDYVEGNHRLEMLWTIVPAGILLFIAIAQINAWERIKYQAKMPDPDLIVQVTARQWDWTLRYPADDERQAPTTETPSRLGRNP